MENIEIEEKYYIYVDCKNCSERKNIGIQKCKEIKDTECPNCGCKTLVKV